MGKEGKTQGGKEEAWCVSEAHSKEVYVGAGEG